MLAAAAGLATAGSASASTSVGGCRAPLPADGLSIQTCVGGNGGNGVQSGAFTSGSNNTDITLCAEVVDSNQNVVNGSRNCAVVWGPNGAVYSNWVSVGTGTYYGVSYFTSPTYWYGGESPWVYVVG